MAVNIGFILKHYFVKIEAPRWKGFAVIQVHHKNSMVSMKDILYSISTSFELMNPILGIIPGSPMPKKTDAYAAIDMEDDVIDMEISNASSDWQKQTSAYVSNIIEAKSKNKLKKVHQLWYAQ